MANPPPSQSPAEPESEATTAVVDKAAVEREQLSINRQLLELNFQNYRLARFALWVNMFVGIALVFCGVMAWTANRQANQRQAQEWKRANTARVLAASREIRYDGSWLVFWKFMQLSPDDRRRVIYGAPGELSTNAVAIVGAAESADRSTFLQQFSHAVSAIEDLAHAVAHDSADTEELLQISRGSFGTEPEPVADHRTAIYDRLLADQIWAQNVDPNLAVFRKRSQEYLRAK